MYLLTTFQKPFEKPVKPPKVGFCQCHCKCRKKNSPDTIIGDGEVLQFIDKHQIRT